MERSQNCLLPYTVDVLTWLTFRQPIYCTNTTGGYTTFAAGCIYTNNQLIKHRPTLGKISVASIDKEEDNCPHSTNRLWSRSRDRRITWQLIRRSLLQPEDHLMTGPANHLSCLPAVTLWIRHTPLHFRQGALVTSSHNSNSAPDSSSISIYSGRSGH